MWVSVKREVRLEATCGHDQSAFGQVPVASKKLQLNDVKNTDLKIQAIFDTNFCAYLDSTFVFPFILEVSFNFSLKKFFLA